MSLLDRTLAVAAMLVCVGPLLRGLLGGASHLSWPRVCALAAGALASFTWTTGLLALRAELLAEPFVMPNLLGGALACFGGMLGVATLLARRGPEGMTEQDALRNATLAAAMALYVAAPTVTLGALGLTRLLRATLPWTLVRFRWTGAVEGVVLLLLGLLQLLMAAPGLEARGLWGPATAGMAL